ncbi:MAG: acyl carrier protein [Firmicutes bacterium]|jgi:acyl carrier protein|nr:acyl carrier protein [Bacillota bacterium]MBR6684509.1 acyl carrier protein [Bacillota bacterium]
MSRDELSIIQEIIAEEMDLNPQDITEEMTLDEDLDMDQNSILQVLMACEVEFNVEYEQEDIRQIKTVEDILKSLAEW